MLLLSAFAYSLSLRKLEQIITEGGIVVYSTLHRRIIRLVPLLDVVFRRDTRRPGGHWQMDETYIKVKSQWKYLYRTTDSDGQILSVVRWGHLTNGHKGVQQRAVLLDEVRKAVISRFEGNAEVRLQ
jgi:hypothetical protein